MWCFVHSSKNHSFSSISFNKFTLYSIFINSKVECRSEKHLRVPQYGQVEKAKSGESQMQAKVLENQKRREFNAIPQRPKRSGRKWHFRSSQDQCQLMTLWTMRIDENAFAKSCFIFCQNSSSRYISKYAPFPWSNLGPSKSSASETVLSSLPELSF